MIFNFGKNNNIKLYRVVDKDGNYLRAYRTTKNPKEATLYEYEKAKVICIYDRKLKIEPVSVIITVKEETKNGKKRRLRFETIKDKSYPDGLFLTEKVRDDCLVYLKKVMDKSKKDKAIFDEGPIYIPYHTLAKYCYVRIQNAKKIKDKYYMTYDIWWDFNNIECHYCDKEFYT